MCLFLLKTGACVIWQVTLSVFNSVAHPGVTKIREPDPQNWFLILFCPRVVPQGHDEEEGDGEQGEEGEEAEDVEQTQLVNQHTRHGRKRQLTQNLGV